MNAHDFPKAVELTYFETIPVPSKTVNSGHQDAPYTLGNISLVGLDAKHTDPENQFLYQPWPDDLYGRTDLLRSLSDINRRPRRGLVNSSEEAMLNQITEINDEIAAVEPIYAFVHLGRPNLQSSRRRTLAKLAIVRGLAIDPDLPLHHVPKIRNVLEDSTGKLGTHAQVRILKQIA